MEYLFAVYPSGRLCNHPLLHCLLLIGLKRMEPTESLNQKLLAVYGAVHQLERTRVRAIPGWARFLEGVSNALPLGMIPITLVWTAIVFFLPYGDHIKLIRLYALGLFAMLLSAGLLAVLVSLVSRLRLKDLVLLEIAGMSGLAFHPNNVLRRVVAVRGYATLGEFRTWYLKQREILDTRVSDFEAQAEGLRGPKIEALSADQLPEGARAFVESK